MIKNYPDGISGEDKLEAIFPSTSNALADLKEAGITNVEQLVIRTDIELYKIWTSKKSVREFYEMKNTTGVTTGVRIEEASPVEIIYPQKKKRTQLTDQLTPDYKESRDLLSVLNSLKHTYSEVYPSGFRSFTEPADDSQLENLAAYFDSTLPDSLVTLLKFTNGEIGPSLKAPALLPYDFSLFSVPQIITATEVYFEDYELKADWENQLKEGNSSGKVMETFWSENWFPFAYSEGRLLSIDMNPGDKGQAGQIIFSGRVPAGEWFSESLEDFFGQIEYGLSSGFYLVDHAWEKIDGTGKRW